jgi:hypothetical protein
VALVALCAFISAYDSHADQRTAQKSGDVNPSLDPLSVGKLSQVLSEIKFDDPQSIASINELMSGEARYWDDAVHFINQFGDTRQLPQTLAVIDDLFRNEAQFWDMALANTSKNVAETVTPNLDSQVPQLFRSLFANEVNQIQEALVFIEDTNGERRI